jgi:hypothetical protein
MTHLWENVTRNPPGQARTSPLASLPRKPEQSLASPHSNEAHATRLASIDDPKWCVDGLSQSGRFELGNDSTGVWLLAKSLDAGQDFRDQATPNLRNTLCLIVGDDFFEVADGGFR